MALGLSAAALRAAMEELGAAACRTTAEACTTQCALFAASRRALRAAPGGARSAGREGVESGFPLPCSFRGAMASGDEFEAFDSDGFSAIEFVNRLFPNGAFAATPQQRQP
jgi:hypothetical protein